MHYVGLLPLSPSRPLLPFLFVLILSLLCGVQAAAPTVTVTISATATVTNTVTVIVNTVITSTATVSDVVTLLKIGPELMGPRVAPVIWAGRALNNIPLTATCAHVVFVEDQMSTKTLAFQSTLPSSPPPPPQIQAQAQVVPPLPS